MYLPHAAILLRHKDVGRQTDLDTMHAGNNQQPKHRAVPVSAQEARTKTNLFVLSPQVEFSYRIATTANARRGLPIVPARSASGLST